MVIPFSDFDFEVVIIGAGVSGIRTAMELELEPDEMLIVEKTGQVGGRVKTFQTNGYFLDRGFQILLTAYPEVNNVLDLDGLNTGSFMNGAYIRTNDRIKSLIDPLSHPIDGTISLFDRVGSLVDKWNLFRLRRVLKARTISEIFEKEDTNTETYLRECGFTDDLIEKFFRPFFSGVFLENGLDTSSRMFEFVYKMFAEGDAVLPENGIQAIPRQMASNLPDQTLRFNSRIESIDGQTVQLSEQENITARYIIDATSNNSFDLNTEDSTSKGWHGTNCYYFELDRPPTQKPILYINAGDGLINNLCCPSIVNESYAPDQKHLLSVSTLRENRETVGLIRGELIDWFGPQADDWSLLGRYELEKALPVYPPDQAGTDNPNFKLRDGLYRVGDVTATPSLNGALKSGRKAGSFINEELSKTSKRRNTET
jgi:phytoene dehydrogenase-like protein